MTSTDLNIGLAEKRPSSRVLRPPGGGHTDIFGGPEPQPVRKDNGRNASSILEGTNVNATLRATAPPSSPIKKPTPLSNPVNEPAPSQPMQRAKVPPGGFSSGLW